ncbi:MAG: hypothetical protein GXY44_04160 [Phycisphaerales bacterium]|nr:hypothetical protein [Phycisphaerales bacterium]
MQIFVDDQPYVSPGIPGQTVAELANQVCQNSTDSANRMVVAIRCNGAQVGNDQLESVLASPAEQYDSIELLTQPVAAMVKSTLSQAIEIFEQSAENRRKAADLITEGRQPEAMSHLQNFLDVWRQVQESMLMCAQAMQVDLEVLTVNDLNLTDILALIKNQLNDLKAAMESGDYVVVGDILRYEFDEPCEHWIRFLGLLCEQADKRLG